MNDEANARGLRLLQSWKSKQRKDHFSPMTRDEQARLEDRDFQIFSTPGTGLRVVLRWKSPYGSYSVSMVGEHLEWAAIECHTRFQLLCVEDDKETERLRKINELNVARKMGNQPKVD